MKRVKGFTLIELLMTLAVLIILATVAVPGFQRMMAVNRVVADYNEILSGLNFARSEAVKRRAEVKFQSSNSNSGAWKYTVLIVDGDTLREREGQNNRTSINEETVTFNALGRREGCPGPDDCVFEISSTFSGVDARRAEVSIMGRVGKASNT